MLGLFYHRTPECLILKGSAFGKNQAVTGCPFFSMR
jgi:hypothetical protein